MNMTTPALNAIVNYMAKIRVPTIISNYYYKSCSHFINHGYLGNYKLNLWKLLPTYRTPLELRINELFFQGIKEQRELLSILRVGFIGN